MPLMPIDTVDIVQVSKSLATGSELFNCLIVDVM
jgi:hypothetical protein